MTRTSAKTNRGTVMKALGSKIRKRREKKGWPQDSFAKLCGLARGHLSRIERGEINARLGTLVQIAGGLNMTVSELFQGVG